MLIRLEKHTNLKQRSALGWLIKYGAIAVSEDESLYLHPSRGRGKGGLNKYHVCEVDQPGKLFTVRAYDDQEAIEIANAYLEQRRAK